ncbi:MAG: energy-coupling factor transporter transmembrane component T family protein [Nitrososphaeria archaeon]
MEKKMIKTLFGYMPVNSPIYKLHPITKIAFLLIVSAYPLLINTPGINALGLITMIILLKISKVELSILKNYKYIIVSLIAIVVVVYTFAGGYAPTYTILYRIGPIIISYENEVFALVTAMKLIFAVFVVIFFLSTTREREVVQGLRFLKIPYTISLVAGLALRAISLSLIDFFTIQEAQKARAFDLSSLPIMEKIKQYGLYVIPLLAVLLRRAEDVSLALDARGFMLFSKQKIKRTDYILSQYHVGPLDILVLLILFALLSIILLGDYLGWFTITKSITSLLI